MFVTGIDVRLGPNAHDPVEVVNVDMDKNSVQSGQDLLALRLETFGEGDICCDRKQLKHKMFQTLSLITWAAPARH